MGPPRVIGGYRRCTERDGQHDRRASMGPPRVIGGYGPSPWSQHGSRAPASMGPPRVIGGYTRFGLSSPRSAASFNGAAESNRRILRCESGSGDDRVASMGPPRVIGGYGRHVGRDRASARASMGPPRVIGGYRSSHRSGRPGRARFNGAAESNRRIRDACQANGVAFHLLQWGRRE